MLKRLSFASEVKGGFTLSAVMVVAFCWLFCILSHSLACLRSKCCQTSAAVRLEGKQQSFNNIPKCLPATVQRTLQKVYYFHGKCSLTAYRDVRPRHIALLRSQYFLRWGNKKKKCEEVLGHVVSFRRWERKIKSPMPIQTPMPNIGWSIWKTQNHKIYFKKKEQSTNTTERENKCAALPPLENMHWSIWSSNTFICSSKRATYLKKIKKALITIWVDSEILKNFLRSWFYLRENGTSLQL